MANVIEITDFSAPELDVYARLTEAQLLNRFEPAKGMFIAESPKVIHRALDGGYEPVSLLMERKDITGAARIVVLENVQNPTNVGAIFRSAAALGMDAVLLTPGCSDPLYRRSARVSMGTVFQIPWTFTGDWPGEGMAQLRRLGFKTAAMALSDDSVSIDDRRLMAEEKLAVILGSEGDGLTETTIARCDYTVKIPMYHGVDSLNVAAASAVAFWQLRKG